MITRFLPLLLFALPLCAQPLSPIDAPFTQNCSPLLTGLISYWPMQETTLARYDSASGNNTLTNGGGSAAGVIGNGGRFISSIGQYMSHADNSSLRAGATNIFISCWCMWTNTGQGQEIVSKFGNTGNEEYALLLNNGTKRFNFYVSTNGTASTFVDASTFGTTSPGTWYHVAAWWDAKTYTAWIGVNLVTNSLAVGNQITAGGNAAFMIGNRQDATLEYFNGVIDEVGLWKGTIPTTAQRVWIYNNGLATHFPFANR